ncbi:VOC family protein [Robiginitalea sp.]
MKNAINWFDIPVKDFDRAKTFYETVLDTTMET